jgi:flagellar motor switch protein FliM
MSEPGIIRKKLAAQRVDRAEGGPGADRGWRVALARAAQDLLKLSLDVKSLSIERRSLAELAELIPERALIAILEGPQEGLGAIIVSQPILTAFIEAQTIGRLRSAEVVPRKPTRTDAAMVAEVIDHALAGLEEQLAEEADLVWAGGFRYASFLDDPRPLLLLLEDAPMKLMRAEVSLGGGLRQGPVLLAVPAEGRGSPPAEPTEDAPPESHSHVFSAMLAEKVMETQARVDAVLARVTMSLAEVMSLEVGAVLPLGDASLESIRLEGLDGAHVADGKLGQNRGLRAIRIGEAEGPKLATGEMQEAALGHAMPAMDLGSLGGGDFAQPMADFGADFPAAGLDQATDFPAMDFPAMDTGALDEFLPTGTS